MDRPPCWAFAAGWVEWLYTKLTSTLAREPALEPEPGPAWGSKEASSLIRSGWRLLRSEARAGIAPAVKELALGLLGAGAGAGAGVGAEGGESGSGEGGRRLRERLGRRRGCGPPGPRRSRAIPRRPRGASPRCG